MWLRMYKGLPAEEELYRAAIELGLKSGAKTVIAKVAALLFMEPRALSLEEIAERTGYSLASISNAVKHLELLGKVKRIKEPGSKKIYVEGEKNYIRMIHQQFKHVIDVALKPMQDIIPNTIQELKKELKDPAHEKKKKEHIKEKIVWYEEYLKQNEKIFELFTTMESSFRKLEQEHR